MVITCISNKLVQVFALQVGNAVVVGIQYRHLVVGEVAERDVDLRTHAARAVDEAPHVAVAQLAVPCAADDADTSVAAGCRCQDPGEVGAVLTGDAGYQCNFMHKL
mgnify:CR=1 FL=1